MPKGRSKVVLEGSHVVLAVENNRFGGHNIQVYGPYDRMEQALAEKGHILSANPGMAERFLRRELRFYVLPTLVWGSPLEESKHGMV